jgi:hypothetical protein
MGSPAFGGIGPALFPWSAPATQFTAATTKHIPDAKVRNTILAALNGFMVYAPVELAAKRTAAKNHAT